MKAKVYIGAKKYAVYIGRKIVEKTMNFFGFPARFLSKHIQDLKQYIIYGQSVQDGIPTPASPVEVESVGDRTRNLFDGDLSMGVYNTTVGDIATKRFSTTRICSSSFTPISPNKTYIITGYKEDKIRWSWRLVLTNENNVITRLVTTNTFTANKNETRLYFYIADDETSTENYKLQLEEGSIATPYEPYGYKVPVVAGSKNLFDKDNIIEGYRLRNAINYEYNKGNDFVPDEAYYVSSLVEVKVGKTYTKNSPKADAFHRYHTYNADKVCVRYIETNTITINDGEKYIALCGKIEELDTTQLEEGDTATPYEPYIEPITTNIYLDEPLRKLGDYVDYIDFDNQKVVRNVGVLEGEYWNNTGSKEWEKSASGINRYYYGNAINQELKAGQFFLCNVGFCDTPAYGNSVLGAMGNTVDTGLSIVMPLNINTVELVKQYMIDNAKLYYYFATPTEESITLPAIALQQGNITMDVKTEIKPSQLTITGDIDDVR